MMISLQANLLVHVCQPLTREHEPAVKGDKSIPERATPAGNSVGEERSGSVPWCKGDLLMGRGCICGSELMQDMFRVAVARCGEKRG